LGELAGELGGPLDGSALACLAPAVGVRRDMHGSSGTLQRKPFDNKQRCAKICFCVSCHRVDFTHNASLAFGLRQAEREWHLWLVN